MKKIFIVMLLVIASGLWNSTNGACMVPAKNNSDLPTISVSGELQERGYPCEPGEICPPCVTPALETDNGIYYLTTTDAEIEAQLDSLFNYLHSLNCICTFPTRVTGTTDPNSSFKYININHIETDDPHSYDTKLSHYFPKGTKWINRKTERDPMTGKIISNSEGTYILSEDTLIGGKTYHKLIDEKGQLFATLREDGKTVLQAAFDTLNTSGKFSDDGVYEGTALGLNGIGCKLVNFLSHKMEVETFRDGMTESIFFEEGVFYFGGGYAYPDPRYFGDRFLHTSKLDQARMGGQQ